MQIVKKSFKNARLRLPAVLVAASAGSVHAGVVFTAGEQREQGPVSSMCFLAASAWGDFLFRVGGLGAAPLPVPQPGRLWSFSLAGGRHPSLA